MRIGLFSDAYLPDVNGVVSSIQTLRDALIDLGHTVFVITNHNKRTIELSEEGILRLPGLEIKRLYGYKVSSPIQITGFDYIKNMHLDVIHVHTEIGIGLFARLCAKKLDIPVVYTYHTMYEDYIHYVNPKGFESIDTLGRRVVRSLSKMAGNGPDAVIAPSNKTKKALQRYGVKTPIYVVPTGIDLSDFKAERLDQARLVAIRKDYPGPTVVCLGRVAKEKGIEIPIEALLYAPEVQLVIVGDGPDRGYYEKLAKKLGVFSRTHFLGKVAKADVPYYYRAFDAFVSGSLSETQGMTYLEALASELVVFGRRDEVLDGLVEEGKTGYYFDDAKELALKWSVYFSLNEAERQAMKPACVKKTLAYDTKLFAQKVLAVYEQAISDYQDAYTIKSIKYTKTGFAQITFVSHDMPITVEVAEEEVLNQHLMQGARVDKAMVRLFMSMESYYHALAKLKSKLARAAYSVHQIREYALYKLDLDSQTCEQLIETLQQDGSLDDKRFACDRAAYYHALGKSPKQISQKLFQAGVDSSIIDEALSLLDDDQEKKNASKLAKRLMKSASPRAVFEKLLAQGYSLEEARLACELAYHEEDGQLALVKTLAKARRLYDKDVYKIKEYCMKKGFTMQAIDQALESEELDD